MIYQFKVTLKDVGIPVWRRIQIESESTFEELHYVLMASFDWLGYHLHEFEIRKTNGERSSNIRIGLPEGGSFDAKDSLLFHMNSPLAQSIDFGFPRFLHEKEEQLSAWFKVEKDRALYTYDFGDNWDHDIVLEKILEPEPHTLYPLCIKAKNDTPPEDSRMEMLDDEIDLKNPDWKVIVEDINDTFRTAHWKKYFLNRDHFI